MTEPVQIVRRVERVSVGPWADVVLELPAPAWIAGAFLSSLVSHGWQMAPAGEVRLRALPDLGEPWMLLSDRALQGLKLRLEPRTPGPTPGFERSPSCVTGCEEYCGPQPVIRFVSHPDRARAIPARGLIEIDPTWWASLRTVGARLCIIGHELGHLVGAECQACADFYAGRWLSSIGLSYRDPVLALEQQIHTRDAAAEYLRGAL